MSTPARQPRDPPLDPALLRVITALAQRQARLDYLATQQRSRPDDRQ